MKKIIIALTLIGGFTASVAQAVVIDGPIVTTDCTMLNENTTVNLSKGVVGGYKCDVPNNVLKVATCHPNGSRKLTKTACAVTSADGVTPVTYNGASCTGAPNETFDIKDARGYAAANTGGSAAAFQLSTDCTAAAISTEAEK